MNPGHHLLICLILGGAGALFRGDFFAQESFNGRAIYTRNSFSNITPDSCRFEQAFSDDGGKTWETNWVMTFARVKGKSGQAH